MAFADLFFTFLAFLAFSTKVDWIDLQINLDNL